MNKYQKIINLNHYEPHHPRMSILKRAAQFAPFAALTGYEEALAETSRLTNQKIILSEDEWTEINQKITTIAKNLQNKPLVKITYFVPDQLKNGGEYQIITKIIKRIDEQNQLIITIDKQKILITDIIDLEII